MKVIALVALMVIGNVSWAIEKTDKITNISKDSKFVAIVDVNILANVKNVSVAFTKVNDIFQSCSLFVVPAQNERVLKLGTELTVDRVERIKSGTMYPDGYAGVIFFDHPIVQTLKCFSGEPLSDNHRVPTLEQMERALEQVFKFFSTPAIEIPGKNICK